MENIIESLKIVYMELGLVFDKGDSNEAIKSELDELVSKALEEARNAKVIGKPLEASITIACSEEDEKLMKETLNGKVAQWLIVSEVNFGANEGLVQNLTTIQVEKMEGTVCPRCWNISKEHDENGLCPRCQKVMND